MIEAFSQRDYHQPRHLNGPHPVAPRRSVYVVYLAAKGTTVNKPLQVLRNSALSGLIVGGMVALLVILGNYINYEKVLINASPSSINYLLSIRE